MINKYKYENWTNNYPSNIIEYWCTPCNNGVRLLNFIIQKIFGVNRRIKFMVHFTSIVSGNIKIGKDVVISFASSNDCYVQGKNGVEIGDYTIFAPGVKIISSNHDINDKKKHIKSSPVIIGTNCWLGANSVILPGVVLGDNVIVGAGSVVTKSFNSNLTIAGVPARIIKQN